MLQFIKVHKLISVLTAMRDSIKSWHLTLLEWYFFKFGTAQDRRIKREQKWQAIIKREKNIATKNRHRKIGRFLTSPKGILTVLVITAITKKQRKRHG